VSGHDDTHLRWNSERTGLVEFEWSDARRHRVSKPLLKLQSPQLLRCRASGITVCPYLYAVEMEILQGLQTRPAYPALWSMIPMSWTRMLEELHS
jgi:hypothetical protein